MSQAKLVYINHVNLHRPSSWGRPGSLVTWDNLGAAFALIPGSAGVPSICWYILPKSREAVTELPDTLFTSLPGSAPLGFYLSARPGICYFCQTQLGFRGAPPLSASLFSRLLRGLAFDLGLLAAQDASQKTHWASAFCHASKGTVPWISNFTVCMCNTVCFFASTILEVQYVDLSFLVNLTERNSLVRG